MYDVVIVGSGYGGAVMAGRLSEHFKVLLVERGRRWTTGEFPKSLPQLASAYMSRRNALGLWAMRMGVGTGNAFASAYGGASVVNYGITSRPEDHVFESWPVSARQWDPFYERALSVLKPTSNPVGDSLGDKRFLDLVEPGRRVDLLNTIDWESCTQCGHCCPGCDVGAKRSLEKTYLQTAERNGASVALGKTLVALRRGENDCWSLTLQETGSQATETVFAKQVVLAAGTFGTLDLLNSERSVLPVSPMLGQHMTMNGDGASFLYNTPHSLSGHHGAPITTSVRIPFIDAQEKERTLMVMSGRIPFSMIQAPALLMAGAAGLLPGKTMGDASRDSLTKRASRRLRDLWSVTEKGAMSNTFMFKVDAEDSSSGIAAFDRHGRSSIDWPNYGEEPILQFARQKLHSWADSVGADVIEEIGSWPLMKNMGVHPLGGCRMGTSVHDGVVDEHCRVFKPSGDIYPGLRIVDASVIASSLGVPSSLTVSAIAEKAAEHLGSELLAGV
ncbi:MAG: GMC family oxidoreductase [Myxococcales bacterium]|nr:GMC family oxidoreductase [Myxococcales bacterium]